MDIKVSGELSGILEVLKQMALFEAKIAELYALSASTWKEDGSFWLGIWRDELRHARHVEQIIDIVRKKPEQFRAGRPFNVHTLATINKDIEDKIEMIRKGQVTRDQLLFIAQNLEQGYMEEKYAEIVETDDVEYRTLMQEVISDTQRHKDRIIEQIINRAQNKGYITP